MTSTMTLPRYLANEGRSAHALSGELVALLSSLALGVKYISQMVRSEGLQGATKYTSNTNVQGERVHEIDIESDRVLVELLDTTEQCALMISEERESIIIPAHGANCAEYLVAFDPLDGSSNLGSNIPVGTIFGIYRRASPVGSAALAEDFLQIPRTSLVASGYGIYGSKTCFVMTTGNGVHEFTLDPAVGEFVLTAERLRTPERGSTYSVNEGNHASWDKQTAAFIAGVKGADAVKKTPYSLRYVGSLVADFDRNLKRGGIFLYPADDTHKRGKLRLLYECAPLAFIAEQAGSKAVDGVLGVLDIKPASIHARCPLIVGSSHEVDWFMA